MILGRNKLKMLLREKSVKSKFGTINLDVPRDGLKLSHGPFIHWKGPTSCLIKELREIVIHS